MINILIAVTVWTLIIMSGKPLDELYVVSWIHGGLLFTTFVFALLLDFEDWVYVLLKAPWWIWMTVLTFEELDDWFPPPFDFFNLIFSSIVIFILLAIDYKSLFLKLINTGSQFFNKNYKKFKKSQSANNFQPIELKKLTKLYTHPKQIKWLVMLGILLIGFEMGFLIIFGDNYFTYFLLILLVIPFAYSGNILQSLEESQLDFTTNNFQHFFSTWMSNILYYFTLLLDKIPDIPDSKAQDKKPQKTSKSKKVKAKKFDKYEHMGFFERVKKRVNDQFDERMDELLEHGTLEVRHKNAENLIRMQLAFEYEELRLEKPLILKIINKPYYERKYTLQDIHGDDHSHYAFIFPEVFDNAYQNGKAVKITWSKLTKKVIENIFENDSFDSFSRVFSQVPYSEFNSQSKVKPKESDRLFKKMNKAKGEEKKILEVLYFKTVVRECNKEIEVLNQKISKARTEKSKENYRKKIAQQKSKIIKAFQLRFTEEKLNKLGLVDMGDGNYGDGETITHVIEGFDLVRVAKDKQNLSPNIDEPKSASIEDELKKLKSLLDQGLITKKQYEDKTNKLLGL